MKLEGREISLILIGASAGGVTAINTILNAFGSPPQVPILVTIHIPQHTQFIGAAFGSSSVALTIKEAEDKEKILPGVIYFAPSDYHLLVEKEGTLSLSSEPLENFARPSIDVMFDSAAQAYGKQALGVLLTGANEDGALGLKNMSDAGAMTWVQDPQEAVSSLMPESALACFRPNRVLKLRQMGELLNGNNA